MRSVVIALCLLVPELAHAHGRPPNVGQIVIDPSNDDRIVVQFSYGLLVSTDHGVSFRFVCSAAFGADPSIEDPPIAVADDGGVALGTYDGIVYGEPNLCSFAPAPDTAADTFVIDVTRDPNHENAMWTATARVPDPDVLQHSDDGGRTWAIASTSETDVLLEHIATAPSDPMRVYLSAYVRQTADTPRRGFILRSDDGGSTFMPIEVPLIPDEQTPVVVAVDPTDADRIFVRMRKGEIDITDERLLYSDDGGDILTPVFSLPAMEAIAISPDGQTIYVGSSDGGLYRAEGGTTTFTEIGNWNVRSMAVASDGELWLGMDPYRHRYAIAHSIDGGVTIEPALWLEDVTQLMPCDTCTEMHLLCVDFLQDTVYDVDRFLGSMTLPMPVRMDGGLLAACAEGGVLPIDAGPRPDGGRMIEDGGHADAGAIELPGGCGCHTTRSDGSWLAVFLLALFFIRRR